MTARIDNPADAFRVGDVVRTSSRPTTSDSARGYVAPEFFDALCEVVAVEADEQETLIVDAASAHNAGLLRLRLLDHGHGDEPCDFRQWVHAAHVKLERPRS